MLPALRTEAGLSRRRAVFLDQGLEVWAALQVRQIGVFLYGLHRISLTQYLAESVHGFSRIVRKVLHYRLGMHQFEIGLINRSSPLDKLSRSSRVASLGSVRG